VREGAVIDALGDVISGSQVMKDPAEGAHDSIVAFSDSLTLGSRCGAEERGGSGENECARVRRREPSAGFVRAENPCDSWIQMNGCR
jgi:hypothetical protein